MCSRIRGEENKESIIRAQFCIQIPYLIPQIAVNMNFTKIITFLENSTN